MIFERVQVRQVEIDDLLFFGAGGITGRRRLRRDLRASGSAALRECWFCASLEDTLTLMRATVMMEGKPYYKVGGSIGRYPKFVPEDYVILRLNPRFQKGEWVQWMQEMPPGSPPELLKAAETFSNLKLGFRGDLKFQQNPEVIEVAPLVEAAQTQFLDISFLM